MPFGIFPLLLGWWMFEGTGVEKEALRWHLVLVRLRMSEWSGVSR